MLEIYDNFIVIVFLVKKAVDFFKIYDTTYMGYVKSINERRFLSKY